MRPPRRARRRAAPPGVAAPSGRRARRFGSCAPPCASRRATARCASSCRRSRGPRTSSRSSPIDEAVDAAARRRPVRLEGYAPPSPRACAVRRHPRPGRARGEPPADRDFREYVGAGARRVRRGAARGPARREVPARRPPGRQRRRPPPHPGRPHAAREPVPAAPRPAREHPPFLQHHPSLSYLFTGLFVGPTSQAPRVDEARHDVALRARDRARARVRGEGRVSAALALGRAVPALAGRRLRQHAPHRALHRQAVRPRDAAWPTGPRRAPCLRDAAAPADDGRADGARARHRRGVRRASPTARRSCAGATRCTTAISCRPTSSGATSRTCSRTSRRAGCRSLDPAWYQPFLELRCPRIGVLQAGDVTLEVRNALEPWPVLGEEASTGGTSRYVDSSMERIEVRAEGLVPERHVVLVNGLDLPLRPTGTRRRARRGRALPRVGAAALPAPAPSASTTRCASTWSTPGREALARRVHVPRVAPRGPRVRRAAAHALRGRGAARAALHRRGPAALAGRRRAGRAAHPDAPYTLDLRRLPVDRPIAAATGREPDPWTSRWREQWP